MKHTPRFFVSVIRLSLVALLWLCPVATTQGQNLERLAATRDGNGAPQSYLAATPHATAATARARPRRHIMPLRVSDTPEGSRVVVSSDASLEDYSTYLADGRFYVLIPHADATDLSGEIKGRNFQAARLERRADGLLLSFGLQTNEQPRVTQKFNRLQITFPTASQDATQKPTAAAAAVSAQGEQEQLQQLLKRIEDLEVQVRELRANAAAAASTQTPDVAAAPQVSEAEAAAVQEAEAQAVLGSHEHESGAGGPRLKIQGFADINLRVSNGRGTTNAFSLGQLDLFITSQLSEKFSVVSELIMEAKRDNSFEFEIHRLLLRYAMNDYLNLSAGRYHTGIGYYNTAFHHGSYFATAANRPFLFAFESQGGVLPLHNVGVSATGRVPSGKLGLRYIAEVGNGRSARSAADRSVQTAFDENNGKSYNLGLNARPDWLPGLQTGVSFYHDRLTPTVAPNIDQRILAGHIIYQSPRYEWLNEAVFIRHKPVGAGVAGVATYTPGFYTQFARRFGKAQPYFRYQYVNALARDLLFRDVGRRNGPSFGLRYDVTNYAAFKAQYDRTGRRGLSALDELIMQLAFTF